MLKECILFQLTEEVDNALKEKDYLDGLQKSYHQVPKLRVFVYQLASKTACIITTNLKALFTNSFFILGSLIKKVYIHVEKRFVLFAENLVFIIIT